MKIKIAVVGIVLFVGYIVMAKPNKPDKPIKPNRLIVLALEGIQNAIWSLTEKPAEAEKEWYSLHFGINPSQSKALFVVPPLRQFVLLRLYSAPARPYCTDWHLAVNETSIVDGSINKYGYETESPLYKYEHDFPDGCITIDANDTLNAINDDTCGLNIIIIGYFRDMPL